MHAFREIARSVLDHVPDVLEQFSRVTDQEPWIHLPTDYRFSQLDEVIPLATELSLLRPDDTDLCRRMLHRAAEHGSQRLEQGLSDSTIFQELYLVRESLWTYLKRENRAHGGLLSEAIVRIDMALSLSAKASLRGYHRPAFEQRGDWPEVIDQLVDEWAPPPPLEELFELVEEEEP